MLLVTEQLGGSGMPAVTVFDWVRCNDFTSICSWTMASLTRFSSLVGVTEWRFQYDISERSDTTSFLSQLTSVLTK